MYIDKVTELAVSAGIQPSVKVEHLKPWKTNIEAIIKFANLVAEHERKECANLAEKIDPQVAVAIRNREKG